MTTSTTPNPTPNPIDLLKDRRRERIDAATKAYWAEAVAIAANKTSGKNLEASVAKIDAAAATLGKDEDAVEADVLALQELAALEPKQVAAALSRIEGKYREADASIRAAEAALDAAQRALADAVDARQLIGNEAMQLGQQRERVEALRRQLGLSGCPSEVVAKF